MKRSRQIAIVLAIAAASVHCALGESGCDARAKVPSSARTFVKTDSQSSWREYRNRETLPELALNGGTSAQFWQERSKTRFVNTIERDQDYLVYTRYCFASDGKLEAVGFEIRTFLGWGLRSEGIVNDGHFQRRSDEFFSLKDGKSISQPEGVGDAPARMAPPLYLTLAELPFADLLTAAPDPNRQQAGDVK